MDVVKGVVLQQGKSETGPVLLCENCGERITEYGMAWVMWNNAKLQPGERIKPIILCKKNHCNSRPPYDRYVCSMEMRDFLVNLCRNLGITNEVQFREALEATLMMEQI